MRVNVQKTVQTAVAGLTAFTAGRAIAEEWRRGRTPLDELKRAWEVDSKQTVVLAAGMLGLTAWSWMKNRNLLVAAGVGVLVGSGLAQEAAERLGAWRAARQLEAGPEGTTPSEATVLSGGNGHSSLTPA